MNDNSNKTYCDLCQKEVRVRKSGELYTHLCKHEKVCGSNKPCGECVADRAKYKENHSRFRVKLYTREVCSHGSFSLVCLQCEAVLR